MFGLPRSALFLAGKPVEETGQNLVERIGGLDGASPPSQNFERSRFVFSVEPPKFNGAVAAVARWVWTSV